MTSKKCRRYRSSFLLENHRKEKPLNTIETKSWLFSSDLQALSGMANDSMDDLPPN